MGDSDGVEYDQVQRADWNLAECAPIICMCANEVEPFGIELIAT